MSVSPGWAAVASCLSRRLQGHQAGLPQAPIILLLLPWVPEYVRPLCVPVKSESLFPPPLWDSWNRVSVAFKAKFSGGLFSQCRTPGLGRPTWGLNLSLHWENLCNFNYFPFGSCQSRGMGLTYIATPSLPHTSSILCIFSWRPFLIGSRSLSLMIALQKEVLLVCLWEEVSSGSSSSTILSQLSNVL